MLVELPIGFDESELLHRVKTFQDLRNWVIISTPTKEYRR